MNLTSLVKNLPLDDNFISQVNTFQARIGRSVFDSEMTLHNLEIQAHTRTALCVTLVYENL